MLSEIKELNSEQELLKDKHDTIYNTIINDDALAINEFDLHQLTNLNYLNLTYNYIPNTNIAWTPVHYLPNNLKGDKTWNS